MSKYDWAELMRKWTLEEMTAEQAIGQLLLWTQERFFAQAGKGSAGDAGREAGVQRGVQCPISLSFLATR